MDKKKNYRIGVDYKLYTINKDGETLEEETSREEPFRFLSGFSMVLDDFEKAVGDLAVGEAFDFTVPVERAYGEYDERGRIDLDRSLFEVDGKFDDKNIKAGNVVPLQNDEGRRFMATVVSVDNQVHLDLNHPLAGKQLHFVGTVVEREEASAKEIQAVAAHLAGECGGCGGDCGSCGGGCEGGCGSCN